MTHDRVIRRRSVYADRLLAFRDFTLSDGAEFDRRGAWRDFFGPRIGSGFDGRVIFEIGCSDASFLVSVATRHPTAGFIGVDWKCRALHTAAERVAAAGLRNVALLHGRGQDVQRIFADGEVDEIWVFHPDPCDKPQELKNRLIAEPFVRDAHVVLREDGELVLKTDHSGYYQAVRELFGQNVSGVVDRLEVTGNSADFWNDEAIQSSMAGKCFAGESTFFENRFRRKRLPIYYLQLGKRSSAKPQAEGVAGLPRHSPEPPTS